MKKGSTKAICLLLAALTSGCAAYRPGTSAFDGMESIWVAQAINNSVMPQFATVVSERVRDAFMEDPVVHLVRRDKADTRLDITVENLTRDGRVDGVNVEHREKHGSSDVTTYEEDKGLAQAYDVTVTVRAVLTDNHTGEVLMDRNFSGTSQGLPSPYLISSPDDERILMPVLARDISRQIHDAIAYRWETTPDNE